MINEKVNNYTSGLFDIFAAMISSIFVSIDYVTLLVLLERENYCTLVLGKYL